MLEISEAELDEFRTEALDLLDEAEQNLLALEKGGDFGKTYAAVFRVFHSCKGGAGMMGLAALQDHMHKIETQYQECKALPTLPPELVSYFLLGVDAAKQILKGSSVSFDYSRYSKSAVTSPAPAAAPPLSTPSQGATSPASKELAYKAEDTNVVVIDDEQGIVEVLSDLLTDSGFIVHPFTDPKLALSKIKSLKPDVVFTDFKMPEITGLDVLKQIRQFDADLPVIYVSGHLSKDVFMQSLTQGIFGAIEKPFKQEQIISMCKNAAERYKVVKLLNNTINFIYFQYSDLDQFLQAQGASEIREQMHSQFRALIEAKRKLKFLKSAST